MADLYSTSVLNRVVASLLGNPQFLLDRYFGNTQTETTEEIHFDTLDGKRRVSPFVSPLVEGQIVAHQGFKTSMFKPAYIKDKRVFDMNRPLKRIAGEQLFGSMSPMDRQRVLIAQDSQDQLDMLRRRLETMAGQILSTGMLTISGDKYPTQVLDFGMGANTSTGHWQNIATSKPLDDLQAWSLTVLQATGVLVNDVLMTPLAWSLFLNSQQVKDHQTMWRTFTTPPTLSGNAPVLEGGVSMGTIAGFNIFVYSAWYVDPLDGNEKPILTAPDLVALTSPALEGYQAYGAIRDEEAGLQAVPYFSKSWIEPDPSVRFLMLQSAPLLVPYRPGALYRAFVNNA
jgi:Phage major capsid protein E